MFQAIIESFFQINVRCYWLGSPEDTKLNGKNLYLVNQRQRKNKTKQKKPTILDETKGRKNTFPVEELRKENAHHALQTMQAGE